jgi:hypothetical protein
VTGHAADLVVQVAAEGDALPLGMPYLEPACGGEELNERLNLLIALRVADKEAGHGGARLGRLRISHELAKPADANAAGHLVEHGRLLAEDGRVARLVAAEAAQLVKEQLSAADRVGLLADKEAFEAGDDRVGVRRRREERGTPGATQQRCECCQNKAVHRKYLAVYRSLAFEARGQGVAGRGGNLDADPFRPVSALAGIAALPATVGGACQAGRRVGKE